MCFVFHRCPNLKKLILNSNRLVTLPEAIHFINETLEQLELADNPEMVWPPKPRGMAQGSGVAFYNIDFSLQAQLRNAGAQAAQLAATLAQQQGKYCKCLVASFSLFSDVCL